MSVTLSILGNQIPCSSIDEAQLKYCDERDVYEISVGPTGSRFPDGMLKIGDHVLRVAYNGSVWRNETKVRS